MGIAFIIAQQVSPCSLVLENNIELDDVPEAPKIKEPKANPRFRWMRRFVFLEKTSRKISKNWLSPTKLVLAWSELHQEELMANWKLVMNGEEPFKIQPLQ